MKRAGAFIFGIWLAAGVDGAKGDDLYFDFEGTGCTWKVETVSNMRGVHGIELSDERKKKGRQSLLVDLDLNGSDPAHAAGEVFTDLRVKGDDGYMRGIDLRGKRVEIMVYAPTGASGEMGRPNGLQVFAKDDDWRSAYGTWNVIRSGRWLKLEFIPEADSKDVSYAAVGFNPSRIATIGLRILVPGQSKATYQGPLYVDEVVILDH